MVALVPETSRLIPVVSPVRVGLPAMSKLYKLPVVVAAAAFMDPFCLIVNLVVPLPLAVKISPVLELLTLSAA